MIVHIALFKWKEGINEKQIDDALKDIRNLNNKCKGIIDILAGKNYHNESKGFTHGIIVLAENQAGLDNYRKHPEHEKVAKNIEKMEADGLGFDFKDL